MSKLSRDNKRLFLLGFFDKDAQGTETLKLNGFILFKHWNGNLKKYSVDIFTEESYKNLVDRRKNDILQKEKLF